MRLAWFSPWPPDRSGVAGRSAELVPLLAAAGHGIDVFVARDPGGRMNRSDKAPRPGLVRVFDAHDFVWRQHRGQYDLFVYQVGNSRWHDFLWPYLFRWPGLSVLHEARLHHARGLALLSRKRVNDYRAEFRWSHPDVSPDVAELAVTGFDGPHYYQWPMTRPVLAASRLVAAHSPGAVAALRAECPDITVEFIALGEGDATPPTVDRQQAARAGLGLPDDAVLFGVFGGLTAEKRLPQILRAFAATRGRMPHAHLVLGGEGDGTLDLDGHVYRLGLDAVTHRVALPDDRAFDAAIAAVDVSLNLRWPTALEMSGPWVRALAAGKPTIIVDLAHHGHLTTLDPRTWRPHAPRPRGPGAPAVAVAIDILDEEHSLRRALVRLAWDAGLRTDLGRAARSHWEAEHTLGRMAADYERVMAAAAALPIRRRPLPAHLRVDPLGHARGLALELGVALPPELDA